MVPNTSKFRLMVEGKDDVHCVLHLTGKHGLDWDNPEQWMPHLHDCKGFDPLRTALPTAFKTFERLGVIVDSDPGTDRYASIKSTLGNIGIQVPDEIPKEGLVAFDNKLKIKYGIWLMPDNQKEGTLESFLSDLVPDNDSCWSYAIECVQTAKQKGANFSDSKVNKANVHTWLAWQENPGLPLGTAIKVGYFETSNELAQSFHTWFKKVFEEPI